MSQIQTSKIISPKILFKGKTFKCTWSNDVFKFAIINNEFYIEELDILNRRYYKQLDEECHDDYSYYIHSIWNYFYKRLNSPIIKKEVWDWLKSECTHNKSSVSHYDQILNEVDHEIDYLRDNYEYENDEEFIDLQIKFRTKDNINYLIENIKQHTDEIDRLELLDFINSKIQEAKNSNTVVGSK